MHHVNRWRDPEGLWWKNVHPMLKGGKTRVVFAGTVGTPAYKYDHIEQDGIHYIQNSTSPTRSVKDYKLERKRNERDKDGMNHQPDNLQLVRVEGDSYTVRTIVVGEWNTPSLSSRFWYEVDQPLGMRQRLAQLFHETYRAFRKFSLANVIWGGIGLIGGLLLAFVWQRRCLSKTEANKHR